MKKLIIALGLFVSFATANVLADSGQIHFSGSIVADPCQVDTSGFESGKVSMSCYNQETMKTEVNNFKFMKEEGEQITSSYKAKTVKIKEGLYRIDVSYN